MKNIFVIAGASGVGKTTIAARLLSDYQCFSFVRSITTRAPRGDGHDGEYIYKSREEFMRLVDGGAFLEYMEYGENLYGTPISELERIFAEEKIPLLILDIEGVKSLRAKSFDFSPIIIYVWDSLAEIEKRLYARDLSKNPSAEKFFSFLKRKEANIADYSKMTTIVDLFDAFIRNEDLEASVVNAKKLFFEIASGEKNYSLENEKTAKMLYEMTL